MGTYALRSSGSSNQCGPSAASQPPPQNDAFHCYTYEKFTFLLRSLT
jgi:hypothetical protein